MDSFVGAGDQNSVSGNESVVGGGQSNAIGAAATYSVVAGGFTNTATSLYAAVGGGEHNNALGAASAVGGGADNSSLGKYAVIPGGYDNAADGMGSFAAGSNAKARNTGAFVWSDNASSAAVQSTANYQFVARATGGYIFYTNATGSGAQLSKNSGTWGSLSDRTMKTNVVPLDDAVVLDKVAALPVSEWSYIAERGVRHVGPMAQDFYAAFGVGEDNRHITSIDEDGVALAAIKALHAENARLHAENLRLHDESRCLRRDFEADNRRLFSRLAMLEAKLDRLAPHSVR
jgi:hypothetical protein